MATKGGTGLTPEHLRWLRQWGHKLDRALRREILDAHRVAPLGACYVRRAALAYRRRFRRLPVIVQMQPGGTVAERRRIEHTLRRRGCRRFRPLPLIDACAAEVPLGLLEMLAADPWVRRLSLDRRVEALLDVAAPTVGAPAAWDAGFTGRGVTVAVLDTGIHPHEDFLTPTPRIAAFVDVVAGRARPYDDHGHGTHVAGILAGSGARSGGRYRGIAPEAQLVGVKVLDATGSGTLSTVIEGVEWCVANRARHGIRVLSMSLGAPAVDSYQDDPLARAVGAAWEAGLVVCVAAGNEGPQPQTIATPGIHPRVITVGATDDQATPDWRDDTVADYSSRGPTLDGVPKPDVVAPGTRITAPDAGKEGGKGGGEPGYSTRTGTSMATPVCSGVAALILQQDPGLTPDEVKARILETARGLGLDASAQGHGLVDARAALLRAAVRPAASHPRSR